MKDSSLKYRMRVRYNLTTEWYYNQLDKQNKGCAICTKYEFRLAVDHCHKTGKIRELLCQRCNIYLGMNKNKIDKLPIQYQQYLKKHQ